MFSAVFKVLVPFTRHKRKIILYIKHKYGRRHTIHQAFKPQWIRQSAIQPVYCCFRISCQTHTTKPESKIMLCETQQANRPNHIEENANKKSAKENNKRMEKGKYVRFTCATNVIASLTSFLPFHWQYFECNTGKSHCGSVDGYGLNLAKFHHC